MANIEYIGSGSDKGKVHIKESSHKTGCGAIIDDNSEDWVETTKKVTCEKNGCKDN